MKTKTILLVEDEPVISADVQDRLESMGYNITLATEALEALAIYEEASFDMVLINFKQKTIADGMVLAHLLHKIKSMSIAFITGARQEDILASKQYDSQFSILYKPFTNRQLQSFIEANFPFTEGGVSMR